MSLINSLMLPLQQKYEGKLDKYELRESRYSAMKLFQAEGKMEDGIFSSKNRQDVLRSFGRDVIIPVLDSKNVTIGNVRQCVVPDDENTSQLITLTFVTYTFGFTMTPAQHMNNEVDYQRDFNHKLESYLLKLASTIDAAAVSQLEADKNIFWTDEVTTDYGYNLLNTQTADALQVPQAQKQEFYNNLESIMHTMDFYGKNKLVTNNRAMADVRYYLAQGMGNAENLAFQVDQNGYEWHATNRVLNGAGVESTLYAMPPGTVGLLNRNDPDAMMRARVHEGEYWDLVQAPIVDMEMGYKYTRSCSADRITALGGAGAAGSAGQASVSERSLLESHEWSTDVVYQTAYVSDKANKYSPIVKAEILA